MLLHDKYTLEMKVGEGSFAKVYTASCNTTGVVKAIKIINSHFFKAGRPTTEVEILKKCKHPNVIALQEEFTSNGDTALVFAAYDLDLESLLRRRRATPNDFPTEHKVLISAQMWAGVAYMHSISTLHRDIKPANVLIRFGSKVQAVLADMGLAVDISVPSPVAGEKGLDASTARVCSSGYVAPELLIVRESKSACTSYGPGVDVWSVAVVTFEVWSLHHFIGYRKNIADEMRIIACRLGDTPNGYEKYITPAPKDTKIAPYTKHVEEDLQNVLALGLRWMPEQRATAQHIAESPSWGFAG